MQKRSFVIFIFCFLIIFSGCMVSYAPTEQEYEQQYAVQKTALMFPLPEKFLQAFALSANNHTFIEKLKGQEFFYRIWVSEMVYQPAVYDSCVNQEVEEGTGSPFNPDERLVALCRSILPSGEQPYSWVQIPNSVDIDQTLTLHTKLKKETSEFYKDLNRIESHHYDKYNNEYLWSPESYLINQRWGRSLNKKNINENRNKENFLSLVTSLIRGDYMEIVQTATKALPRPNLELKQSEFESSRHFEYRVQKAKTHFAAYQQEFRSREVMALKIVEDREKLLVYRTFVLYFGTPKITKVDYNPDTRLFGILIKGSRGGDFRFTTADRIMNDQAPAYKEALKKSTPKVILRVSKRKLLFDGGYLKLPNGSFERILPLRTDDYHSKAIVPCKMKWHFFW